MLVWEIGKLEQCVFFGEFYELDNLMYDFDFCVFKDISIIYLIN